MILSPPHRLAALLAGAGASPSRAFLAALPGAAGPPQAAQLTTALLLAVVGVSKPVTAQPRWMTWPNEVIHWINANNTCAAQNGRLCTYDEFCPDGRGQPPNQNIEGNSNGMFHQNWGWAPTGDWENDWLIVKPPWGDEYKQCVTHTQYTGGAPPEIPAWGRPPYNSHYQDSPAFCCCIDCPPPTTPPPTPAPPSDAASCSNIVYCKQGNAYESDDFIQATGQTCEEACNGNCCVSETGNACGGNTRFKVCADENDGSCNGPAACHNAGQWTWIPGQFYEGVGLISGASCVGNNACESLGQYSRVGSVSGGSCVGEKACHQAGMGSNVGAGVVGNISDRSCVGTEACQYLVATKSSQQAGQVGDITASCKGDRACKGLRMENVESPGPLHSCCNSDNACHGSDCTSSSVECTDVVASSVPENCVATPAPTPAGPWVLGYDGTEANFTGGASNELEVGFYAGVGRKVEVEVLETCEANAPQVPAGLYNADSKEDIISPVPKESNDTHTKHIIGYTFNKTLLVNSTNWDSENDEYTFCQVVNLVIPGPSLGEANWVISQDRRMITLKFKMNADFVLDVILAGATVNNATQTVDFDVDAYKCLGGSDDSFDLDAVALPPNTELAVCIKPKNDAVNIADVSRMTINQDTTTPFVVINGGNVEIPAITEKKDVPDKGFIVKTRVPVNKFLFEGNKNISVAGKVELELAGSTRRLRALVGNDDAPLAETEEAAYAVLVNLQPEADSVGPLGSSGGYVAVTMGFVVLSMAFFATVGLVV